MAASIFLIAFTFIADFINPTPPELMDPKTPEAVAHRVASTPTLIWLTVIIGLALGGIIGAKIAREKTVWITAAIGLALSPWATYTFYVVNPAVL